MFRPSRNTRGLPKQGTPSDLRFLTFSVLAQRGPWLTTLQHLPGHSLGVVIRSLLRACLFLFGIAKLWIAVRRTALLQDNNGELYYKC